MNDAGAPDGLSRDALHRILEITRDLARPLDLATLLYAVVDAAKDLLDAEGATVWEYQAAEHMLEMRVARGLDAIRIPADRGIVGECVRTLAPINVPDCYADPRFNRDIDKSTGRRTRCMLTLPLSTIPESVSRTMRSAVRSAGSSRRRKPIGAAPPQKVRKRPVSAISLR